MTAAKIRQPGGRPGGRQGWGNGKAFGGYREPALQEEVFWRWTVVMAAQPITVLTAPELTNA